MSLDADAWNALATLFAGLVALLLGTGAALRDNRDRAAAKLLQRESAARAISMWEEVAPNGNAVLGIHNYGPLPITKVLVPTLDDPAPQSGPALPFLQPGLNHHLPFGPFSQLPTPWQITFTDAHDVRWRRFSDGTLIDLTEKQPSWVVRVWRWVRP